MRLTQEFHSIQAHHLQYSSLLDDYDKAVKFIMDTTNPMQDNPSFTDEDRALSQRILQKECENLTNETYRLKRQAQLLEGRLTNAIALASFFYQITLYGQT